MRRAVLLFPLLAAVPCAATPAQGRETRSSVVAPGARVRVTTAREAATRAGRVRMATVREVTPDTIVLSTARPDSSIAIPTASVVRVEVSRGRTSRAQSASKGLLIGGLLGIGLGLGLGEDCSAQDFICFDRSEVAAGLGALGAGMGILVGAIAGGRERWEPAQLPARVTVAPGTAGGARVSLSFTF